MQQQFRAKISKISELEKHSHEILTEETEKENPMLPNILRDTESYHLVIGKAFENFISKMSVFDNLLSTLWSRENVGDSDVGDIVMLAT